jgi:DNA-binding NtrC family response regulator
MENTLIASGRPEVIIHGLQAMKDGITWDRVEAGTEMLQRCEGGNVDLVFIDIDLLQDMGDSKRIKGVFQKLKSTNPLLHIIIFGEIGRLRQMVRAAQLGADTYLTIPIVEDELEIVIKNSDEKMIQNTELDYLRGQFWKAESRNVVKTRSARMASVLKKIQSVAPTNAMVLLNGETGTGKGVMAELIHRHSNRAGESFISVHCGAIPDTLLESELFGHEKGAFTGANRKKLGKFEIATNGTIFLDEVGTITQAAQIKLLQVLQDSTFSRVGGDETIKTGARIIAATNTDLKAMTEDGRFRKDLYYRLNVFPVEIPPLRERKKDIPHLIDVFLIRLNTKYNKDITEIHPNVLEAMREYDWPGNVRELENLIERAYILTSGGTLMPQSFPPEVLGEMEQIELPLNTNDMTLSEARRIAVEAFEIQYLSQLLAKHNGRINKSAAVAGIGGRQLHKLMQKYNIRKEQFIRK